jgi:hypothetical protein
MTKVFSEEVVFNAPSKFNMLPTKEVGTFVAGDTTPSVENVEFWKCQGTVVTITDFDNGATTQVIFVLGDGDTTISHNANIKTNTGANKLLAADRLYIFVHIEGVWYEN